MIKDLSHQFTGNELRVYSKKYLDLKNPLPSQIYLEDIARGLATEFRFRGQTQKLITVAEHSIAVARVLEKQNQPLVVQQWGLLHDASEAYLGDVPRPLKKMLPEYITIEKKVIHAISDTFGLPSDIPKEVKEVDDYMLTYEWYEYMLDTDFRIEEVVNVTRIAKAFLYEAKRLDILRVEDKYPKKRFKGFKL